jgi:CheY-like chemotaxis protein
VTRKHRALIVDDEPLLVRALGRVLTNRNIDVDSAMDGKQGLERMLERRYDLVISDLQMPGADGAELLREARDRNLLHGPFVFLTGHGEQTAHDLVALGAAATYCKPIDREGVLALIERWLPAQDSAE